MKKILFAGLIGILTATFTFAQVTQQWKDLAAKAQHYYHTLNNTEIENFSCLFTSDAFVNYANQNFDSTYTYPLKLVWLREGRVYYILQPFPEMLTKDKKRELLRRIQAVKTQFQGFLADWQNFLLFSPFNDIPENAVITYGPDSIDVYYEVGEGNTLTKVEKLFTPAGLLLKVSVAMGNKTIRNYPYYQEVEGKWLCTGWDSQIYEGDEIISGIATRLELQKVQNNWMPIRVDLWVQSKQNPDKRFVSTLFIKDYIFNLAIQEIQNPQSTGIDSTNSPSKK